MKRKILFLSLFVLSCFLFSACKSKTPTVDVLEGIRSALVVKIEYALASDKTPVLADNTVTFSSIADMRIEPSDEPFEEDWIYRFTYNPKEKVINGEEIILLFGSNSMSINGITYQPEPGVDYSSILEWAEGKYHYAIS